MFSLTLSPTALIGVNWQLDLPLEFTVDSDIDPKKFGYPKPLEEKKEEAKVRVKTVELSMTAKAKAKAKKKKDDDDDDDEEKMQLDKEEKKEKEEKKAKDKANDEEVENPFANPIRITRQQKPTVLFVNKQRYHPVYENDNHKSGIVVLRDNSPDESEDVVKVSVPPIGGDDDGDEPPPPEPFDWSPPN